MIATQTQLRPPNASALREDRCAHCTLPVPAGLMREGEAQQFCCAACRTAYELIHSCGLDAYYRLREGIDSSPARGSGRAYAEMDDPVFHRLYVRMRADGLAETELFLENVHCAACVWLTERLPVVVPGVVESRLDFGRATVRVVWEPGGVALSRIARALDSLGYPCHPARGVSVRRVRREEDRRFMIRIAIAGAAAGNVMLLAFALYAGEASGIQASFQSLFRWLSAAIGVLALAWPGAVFFRGAWASVRTRTAQLDLPIALGLGVGGVWGAVNVIRGSGEIYFDSLTVLVFLLLVARWVQHRQQRRASDAVELLYSLTPMVARRVEGDAVREVPVEALSAGDLLEVRAGDSIPADGVVTDGQTQVDQSLLTGESSPVECGQGDPVTAGSVNLASPVRVRVEATGQATRVGRLMRMVAEGAARRAPIVAAADRVAVWFVGVVSGLAALTLALGLWRGDPAALDHAVAVLIVTCPCALSLATPLAMTMAIGRAAKRGILIKGGDALERLARPGVIFLDKTGTVTEGDLSVVEWTGDESAKPLAAALESGNAHPIARALLKALGDPGPTLRMSATHTVGGGIAGTVGGRSAAIGSPVFIEELGAGIPGWARAAIESAAERALTPLVVAVDGRVTAVAALGDAVRPDAKESIIRLRARGWDVRLLSGDHPSVVQAVARHIGIEPGFARGGVSPEEKLNAVLEASLGARVVMVGDGVNDAAALSAASVGIAVHGGAEASLAAADVYLNRPGLTPIVEVAGASRRTMRAIRACLWASLGYNGVAAGLAVTGLINPILAAVLMPISSFTVLALAWRVRTFGGRP